jgi:hypothetical protein
MNKILLLSRTLLLTGALAGSLAATAAGAAGTLTITPSPVNVNAPVDTPKNASITVTNTSGASISFGASTVSGTEAGDVAIGTDTCAGHTIIAGAKCHLQLIITADGVVGTTESATVTLNNSTSSPVASDNINAKVTGGKLKVTKVGHTVTIHNNSTSYASMDYSTFGNVSVTGGTCTDYIAPGTCTLLVTVGAASPSNELQILLNIGQGNAYFDEFF